MSAESHADDAIPWELVPGSIEGTLSDDENARLAAWSATPRNAERLATIRRALVTAHADVGVPNVDGIIATVEARVLREQSTRGRRAIRLGWSHRAGLQQWRSFLPATAIVAVLMLVCMGLWRDATPSRREARYTTRTGEHARVTLRDGTHIMLAPQTTLVLAHDFGRTTRMVSLSGEGYFEVTTSSGIPFVVQTGRISARVLGTAFHIRHYLSDTSATIAVVTGKIETMNGVHITPVTAGQIAYVTDSSTTLARTAELNQFTDWTHGRLVFKRTAVPVVLAALERWYGYQFQLTDSTLASQDISAVFNIADPQEMILVLKETLDVTATYSGKVVVLTPHRAAPLRQTTLTPTTGLGR